MSKLFNENSDSDTELKINTGYASHYNNWRQKEELNKLKTKYGDVNSDSGSSDDDSEDSSNEDDTELKEKFDKEFYKTLAYLKNKDPRIYEKDVCFFEDTNKSQEQKLEKKKLEENNDEKKDKSVFLRDYERKIILEKEGKFSDSEDEETIKERKNAASKLTYVQEQQQLKDSFRSALLEEDAVENDDLLKPKNKSEAEKQQEEAEYKQWLKGNPLNIDKNQEKELKPLRDFWNNPNLDANEKFLRDYILDNKYLAGNESGTDFHHEQTAQDSDENFSEDEKNIEEQEEFEHKYNFRFEEPDKEFIKRYPRTMENTLRKKDTRRAQKRAEVKQRKEEEKLKKKQELLQLKALKRKEIEEKIEKLKEITGNNDIEFNTVDLDADFDPTEHDKKMMEIFNEDYYATAEDDVKPEFPDIDEELGIERTWDTYDPNTENLDDNGDFEEPHCEDPEFNMDADYDESKAQQKQLIEDAKPRKRRRRSKFAEVIAKEKPKFDPKQYKSYDEYFDKYYSLDYEDMIGDLPCRFKYRKVVPNDYGLSVEEILTADDKELNKWCSLKKALQYKPEHVEQNEVVIFKQMARNEARKQRILRSLYSGPEEKDESEIQGQDANETIVNSADDSSRNKKRRKKKKSIDPANPENSASSAVNSVSVSNNEKSKNGANNRQVKRKAEAAEEQHAEKRPRSENIEESHSAIDKPQKFKNKSKKKRTPNKGGTDAATNAADQSTKLSESLKKKSKLKERFVEKRKKGVTRNGKSSVNNDIISMDMQRLKTYGISGKKLKKKLKSM